MHFGCFTFYFIVPFILVCNYFLWMLFFVVCLICCMSFWYHGKKSKYFVDVNFF